MRIGDLAHRTNVAARMLRYYEEHDLLKPRRHANGYRDYTESDVEQVKTIHDLSTTGVPTRFIKIILDRQDDTAAWSESCDDILAEMIRDQIADIDSKITCLTTSRTSLTQFLHDAGTHV